MTSSCPEKNVHFGIEEREGKVRCRCRSLAYRPHFLQSVSLYRSPSRSPTRVVRPAGARWPPAPAAGAKHESITGNPLIELTVIDHVCGQ
jgi:hypothetical protein